MQSEKCFVSYVKLPVVTHNFAYFLYQCMLLIWIEVSHTFPPCKRKFWIHRWEFVFLKINACKRSWQYQSLYGVNTSMDCWSWCEPMSKCINREAKRQYFNFPTWYRRWLVKWYRKVCPLGLMKEAQQQRHNIDYWKNPSSSLRYLLVCIYHKS